MAELAREFTSELHHVLLDWLVGSHVERIKMSERVVLLCFSACQVAAMQLRLLQDSQRLLGLVGCLAVIGRASYT